jgi:glycosyltransferase involved in cell wall biosynthesis
MKILWICGSATVGGAERVTLQLAALLRARGHTVEALCRPRCDLEAALTRAQLRVRLAPLGGPLNVRAIPAISRTLKEVGPDVALVTTANEWVWSCLATRPRSTQLVLVRHMAVPLAWRVRWLASHRADALVAVSDAARRSLLGGAGIRHDHIHLIYNPVRFPPRSAVPTADDRRRAREAMGLPPTGCWVGFFGGLSLQKGLRDVLTAVRRTNDELGSIDLLICGPASDPHADRLLADLTREFRLEGRVRYLGETDRVEQALTAVDVVVMATHSRLSEGLGAVLIEAMACGTPVVAYATGGIPEVVGREEQAGRLAQPDDIQDLARVLIDVLRNPTAAKRMATIALTRAQTWFDPAQTADRYEQLFLSLCGKDDPSGRAGMSTYYPVPSGGYTGCV